MDFTISAYQNLLQSLIGQQYTFQTFEEFMVSPAPRSVILRHDVDMLPSNSLAFAKIQYKAGVRGTYYFRAVPESWDERAIQEIVNLGHEVGYHYECLTTTRGDLTSGIADFKKNLEALRRLAPVTTICMHGSPASPYDSKDLWKAYNYQDYDLLGEPYFDVDFNQVYYLTDTGRCWDGDRFSVRDRVNSGFDISFHATSDITAAADRSILPNQIMFTFHPQRWSNNKVLWVRELLLQNTKNVIKRYFFVSR